jgi:hypothetical protein
MTMSEKPLADPNEFLKRRKGSKKLKDHTELVVNLLDNGFSAYMVWRYLMEEARLNVSRNTVLRFTRTVRPHPKLVQNSQQNARAVGKDTATHAADLREPPTTDRGDPLADNAVRVSTPAKAEGSNFRESPMKEKLADTAPSEANVEPGSPTFADKRDRDGCRIGVTASSANAPAPDALRHFDPNDKAFIEEEQMARWGRRSRQ